MAIKKSTVISQKSSVNSLCSSSPLLLALCSVMIFLCGCASFQQREKVLAVVDGKPITEGDLAYSINITHRRQDLSSAGTIDIHRFVQRMVDDRLITDEARRMAMDKYPEVEKAIQAYILRESVTRLYQNEIVRKVSVTESEIKDFYKKNYERFTLGIIEAKSEEEAGEILNQLKAGGDFKELALKYSTHHSKKSGGEIVYTRSSMSTYIYEALLNLRPGDFSDVIQILNKYYIVESIKREEAPDNELDNSLREKIEQALRENKEKERSDEYLKYLRERANVIIDNELLSSITLDGSSEDLEKWSKDKRLLVEVNGSILTAGDFIKSITPGRRKTKEELIQNWIDRKIVDHEALNRHYEMEQDLKNMVYRYENQLLKNTYIERVVIPKIVITDEILRDYYESNREIFMKPASFRIQQITVADEEKANEILRNLQDGADFSWVAKRRSIDAFASGGGDTGWVSKSKLPGSLMETFDNLKPGDITPVVKIDSQFGIFRLLEKRDKEIEEFDKVKETVYRVYFNEQVMTVLNRVIIQLKTDAQVTIYDEEIQSLEKQLQK